MTTTNGSDGVEVSRRELLRRGGVGLTWGLFGLSMPTIGFAQRALGVGPSQGGSLYDAVIQVFLEGAPSQSDTLDPKRSFGARNQRCAKCDDPAEEGHTHFGKVSLGVRDVDDTQSLTSQVEVTDALSRIAALAADPRSGCGLGIVRSVYHWNGEHGNAQKWTHCFAHDPASAALRPSAAACVAHYRRDVVAGGLPGSAVIRGAEGLSINDAKGAQVPTGLSFDWWRRGNEAAFDVNAAPTARRDRRAQITEAVNGRLLASRPDFTPRAWVDAWRDAEALTRGGKLGPLLRYVENNELLVTPAGGPSELEMMRRLTQAYRLASAGVPFVAVGIEGNDTHGQFTTDKNDELVARNWEVIDVALAEMSRRFLQAGKRVLIVLGGEFGRTPNMVRGRPFTGRDHWAGAFSWGLFSIGQPKFRTGAVGYTGPEGKWTPRTPERLVNPVLPGVVGALVYRCLGIPVGEPSTDLVMRDGPGCPLVRDHARVDGPALMARFGLPPI